MTAGAKTKRCGKCKRELPSLAFNRSTIRKDGLSCWCKQCKSADTIRRNAARASRGLCRCGGKRVEGKKSCVDCLESARATANARVSRHRQAGLCYCGKRKPLKGKTRCATCIAKLKDAHARWLADVVAKGFCPCGKNKPVTGRKYCNACIAASSSRCRKSREALISRGMCICATRRAVKGNNCDECYSRMLTRLGQLRGQVKANVTAGLCACGGRPEKNKRKCQACLERNRLWHVFHHYGMEADVYRARLQEQNGHCAIAGCERKAYAVDHDPRFSRKDLVGHRGILCLQHNTALGVVHDDAKSLRALADYKERHDARIVKLLRRRKEAK